MKFECAVCGTETGVLFFKTSPPTAEEIVAIGVYKSIKKFLETIPPTTKEISDAIIVTDEDNVRVFCWCDKCHGIHLHKILDGEAKKYAPQDTDKHEITGDEAIRYNQKISRWNGI